MYNKKLKPILEDLESKDIEIAGGSVVGMVLSELNSLIKYICNLTKNKEKYLSVQDEVIKIEQEAEKLKLQALSVIDKDKEVLEEILKAYKIRKEHPDEYEKTNKWAVEFCLEVTELALNTLKLSNKISKVGNKMLSSDFKICGFYGFASVEASIVNIKINLDSIENQSYKDEIRNSYLKMYKEAEEIKQEILKDYSI